MMAACLCGVVISMAMPCYSDPVAASAEIASRPTRPKVFTFGKRVPAPGFRPGSSALGFAASPAAAESSNYLLRFPAQSNARSDVYQMLFPYEE
ncbi:hypothetical protein C0J52_02300 [Blattella germanica]|nr:hypothetical protein C0J52_02300 [Blattella germanica]